MLTTLLCAACLAGVSACERARDALAVMEPGDPGIDTVLNLAAGLDARPYRFAFTGIAELDRS